MLQALGPYIDKGLNDGAANPYLRVVKEAIINDLDKYWDALLEATMHGQMGSIGDLRKKKIEDARLEYELRNAFRKVILKDDWGNLTQSTCVALQPWDAWLTTNYTRFAERAIDLVESHQDNSSLYDHFLSSKSLYRTQR